MVDCSPGRIYAAFSYVRGEVRAKKGGFVGDPPVGDRGQYHPLLASTTSGDPPHSTSLRCKFQLTDEVDVLCLD